MRSHRALYPIQPAQTTKHVQHDTLHTSQNKSQGNSPPDFFWNHNPTQFMQLCIHKWPLTAIFYHLHSFCQSHHLRFLTLTKGEHASNSRAKHESRVEIYEKTSDRKVYRNTLCPYPIGFSRNYFR